MPDRKRKSSARTGRRTVEQEHARAPIADWRNLAEYPNSDKASLHQWAWEFLRRNPEYQADWRAVMARTVEILPTFKPGDAISEQDRITLEDERYDVYEPPKLPGESDNQWIDRVGTGHRGPLWVMLAGKWGLVPMAAPEDNYPYLTIFQNALGTKYINEHWAELKKQRTNYPIVAVAFDLTLPLNPQFVAARKSLLGRQRWLEEKGIVRPRENRAAVAKYATYLRILDATASGATIVEMVREFLPGVDNSYPDCNGTRLLREMLAAAERLCKGEFRVLLQLLPRRALVHAAKPR